MQAPGGGGTASFERRAGTRESLPSVPSVSAVLTGVVRSVAGAEGLSGAALGWRGEEGELFSEVSPGLEEEAAAECLRQLMNGARPLEPGLWEYPVEDSRREQRLDAGLERLGASALLACPVSAGEGEGEGVLVGFSPTRDGYGAETVRNLEMMARMASLALDGQGVARKARAEAEQAELLRLTRFQSVMEALSRALTREEVGRAVLELGVPAVGAVRGTVHHRVGDGHTVELVAAVGLSPEEQDSYRSLSVEIVASGSEEVWSGVPVWLESLEEIRVRYPGYVEQLGQLAYALLPLRVEGQTLGLLAFSFDQERRFSEVQRTLMLGLARQCAQALERARLYEKERAARLEAEAAGQRLQLLADAGVLLSSSLEWETTVAGVARLALGTFADWCAVDFLDEHGALRRLTVLHADPDRALLRDGLGGCTPERARPSALPEVVRTGRAQLVTGLGAEGEAGGGSFIIAPLVARQRTVGALSFVRGTERREAFNEADKSLAEDLAARAGLAIDNARLLRKARTAEAESRCHAARLRILVDVDRMLAEAGLDLSAVLDVIARKVSEVLGDGCVIQLLTEDGAWLESATVHHPDPEAGWLLAGTVHARRQRLGQGLHGGVVASGRAVLLPEVDVISPESVGSLPEYLPYLDRYGPQSLLVVPLVVRGRAFGSLGVVRDVSGGRPYTEDDRLLLLSLADRAAMAIEDARLYGAATEAVRLRDDFLSVAGHELKTPLSAMRLQLGLLGRSMRALSGTPGLAARVEKVERSSERLGVLIDELLDAGRITAGRLVLEREEVDLAALVREAVGRMSESFERAGCEVLLSADTPVSGRWDRVRLEQVVGNLLSNAAKYGRGQPVEVRVELVDDAMARLVVKDGGIGIDAEDQGRIFERFERAVSGNQFNGLGLGLWITRQIVESHGGRILVHSTPGVGSTFSVELPRSGELARAE